MSTVAGVAEGLGLPRLAEVLKLPEMRRGRPTVEASRDELDRLVRWAHVSELPDIGPLLKGGELILSTGVALPSDAASLAHYVGGLAEAGVAGLVIELGRRFSELPVALVESAEAHRLPLLALHAEVPFVTITEAIHTIILNVQLTQLRQRDTIHQAFYLLAAEGGSAQDIVNKIAEFARCPVVFESSVRHVLSIANAGVRNAGLLEEWAVRSRDADWAPHTAVVGAEHWMTTPVAARGHVWGRLILMRATPSPHDAVILEQGATALALHLLVERDEHFLEGQAHRTLIVDIINHRYSALEEVHVRADALGTPTRRRTLVPMIVASEATPTLPDLAHQARNREVVAAVAGALGDVGATGLVGLLETQRIGVLLSCASSRSATQLVEPTARAIHQRGARLWPRVAMVIGVGSAVNSLDAVRASFAEADEAADVAWNLPHERLFATTSDIRLKGLIHLLRDEARLQRFSQRELGSLLSYDERHHTSLVRTLAAYLEAGSNKSAAADSAHLTRGALYKRLARIEDILGYSLDDPESRHSLYVALLARQSRAEGIPPR